MSDDCPQVDSIVAATVQGITPNRASCLLGMSVVGFGLCNPLATFFRLVNHVLGPYINNFVIVYYLDYICIDSETLDQHIDYLRLIFSETSGTPILN
jgi:hypothetical protein